jgi:hypothetical protein
MPCHARQIGNDLQLIFTQPLRGVPVTVDINWELDESFTRNDPFRAIPVGNVVFVPTPVPGFAEGENLPIPVGDVFSVTVPQIVGGLLQVSAHYPANLAPADSNENFHTKNPLTEEWTQLEPDSQGPHGNVFGRRRHA